MNNIDSALLEVIKSQSGLENIELNLDTDLRSLELDSLDVIEVVMKIENCFSINISDDQIEEIETLPIKITLRYIKKILKDKFNVYDIKKERYDKIISINKNDE